MFLFRLISSTVLNIIIFGGLLLLPAQTFYWRHGAILVAIMAALNVLTLLALRSHKELLDERFKPLIQKGQPLADKIILLLFVFSFLGWIVFIPLDVFHLHLLSQPGRWFPSSAYYFFSRVGMSFISH